MSSSLCVMFVSYHSILAPSPSCVTNFAVWNERVKNLFLNIFVVSYFFSWLKKRCLLTSVQRGLAVVVLRMHCQNNPPMTVTVTVTVTRFYAFYAFYALRFKVLFSVIGGPCKRYAAVCRDADTLAVWFCMWSLPWATVRDVIFTSCNVSFVLGNLFVVGS